MSFLEGLGALTIIGVLLLIIFIPIIAGIVVAMAMASWCGASGILWWSIVIIVTLIIWGILSALNK